MKKYLNLVLAFCIVVQLGFAIYHSATGNPISALVALGFTLVFQQALYND